jgi:hypothetical protein
MGKKRTRYKVREHQLYNVQSSVWRDLKRENKIDSLYRFRARKIEWMSLFLLSARLSQELLFNKKVRRISLDGFPPVFILGLWRSGTTHLHYMMARDSRFGYLNNHQAFTFNMSLLSLDRLNKVLSIFVPGKRPQDNVRVTLDDPAEEEQAFSTMSTRSSIHSFFFPKNQDYFCKYHLFKDISEAEKRKWQEDYLFLLKNIAYYTKKRRLLLKNPHNTGRVKELLELFPDAKFIFIHRDPFTVYRSTKKLYMQMISSQFLQFISRKEIEELIVENNAKILEKYLTERELIPRGNLVEIGFEELEKNPLGSLKSMYERLGLDGFEDARPAIASYLASVKDYKKNLYEPLPAEIQTNLRFRWSSWFEEFGYE